MAALDEDIDLSLLDAAELRELVAISELYRAETFDEFVRRVRPKFWPVPPHLRKLYALIERTRYEQVFATVSMPPRHGKTTSFALAFAWRTLYDPRCQNFYTTYADDRSADVGLATMQIVEALGMPMHPKKRGQSDWGTMFGGGLRSTSVGGQITGGGANGGLIVCDDLLKGWKAARSKAVRDETYNYLVTDVMSRIEGGASLIVMNTRWHPDDPPGRIQADEMGLPWVHINVPAIGDEFGNPIDERLFPELAIPLWLDVDSEHPGSFEAAMLWYARARRRGEHQWWSLYQGTPRSQGKKIFMTPARYTLPSSKRKETDAQPFDWTGQRGCIILDPAATKKTSADYSAIGVVAMQGYEDDAIARLVDAKKGQMTVPEAARMAYEWKKRYRIDLVVESVGAFAAVPQILKEIEPGLEVKAPPMFGDKFTRAQPAAAAWNTDRYLIPTLVDMNGEPLRHAEWIDDVLEVVQAFTGLDDPEDDLVDMIAHGFNFLRNKVDVATAWRRAARGIRRIRPRP